MKKIKTIDVRCLWPAALAGFLWLLSPSAVAAVGGQTPDDLNTITFSTKTNRIYHDITATQRIDTYATHLLANLDGGPPRSSC